MAERPKYYVMFFYIIFVTKGQIGREVLMRDVSIEYTERPSNY